jgi:putative hydrolase of the HAD superfamily
LNIIFDLDDTLYLEKLYVYQGFLAVARALDELKKGGPGVVRYYQDQLELYKAGSTRIFDELLNRRHIDVHPLEMVKLYRAAPRRLRLLPDVETGLLELKKQGHRLLILTNGDSETQWKKVNALGLKKILDKILVTGDYGKDCWKPSPKLMTEIEAEFGEGRENYLFVGNGEDDRQFAGNAGIDFIYMKRLHRIKSLDTRNYRGKEVKNLHQLASMLISPH